MKRTNKAKEINYLIEQWKQGVEEFKPNELKINGFDLSKDIIEIGNFRLKLNTWGKYSISIIDNNKDLNNILISEKTKAFKYFQTLLKKSKTKISPNDLLDFNLNDRIKYLQIGNIEIIDNSTPFSRLIKRELDIQISDTNKNSDGKWKNNSINYKNVIKVLQEFQITNFNKITEVKVNKLLEDHFRKYFENAHKSKGGSDSLYDLVIGDNDFVIEIKMSKAIKTASGRQKASGQIKQYISEYDVKNFMLLIVGDKEDKQNEKVQYLENEVINDYNCFYYFLEFE